jgi:hypothetical protein
MQITNTLITNGIKIVYVFKEHDKKHCILMIYFDLFAPLLGD